MPESMRYILSILLIYAQLAVAKSDLSLVECRKIRELSTTDVGSMNMPTDVAVDQKGRVYIVDSGNHRVLVYSSGGAYLFSFGSEGTGPAQLKYPVGIDTVEDGRVLVADRGNRRIQIFTHDGKFVSTIKAVVGKVSYEPVDVAVNQKENRIYVTASSPIHQLIVLDEKGKIVSTWGKPGNNEGEFRYPATIAVNTDDDEVYVVDVLNTRVQVFNDKGEFLVAVGSWGVTQGQLFRPKGVALTNNHRVLVSDSYLGVVQLYNSDTRYNGVLALDGGIARFTTPVGLAVDNRNRIYIAESMANRVSICQLTN